jgi:outer membrane protein TolC
MIRSFLILIPLLFALAPVTAVAQQQITLQEAFELAVENNHNIRVQMIRREQSENSVFRGGAGQLPSLGIVGDAEFSRNDADLDIANFNTDGPPQIESISIDGSESKVYNAALQLNYTLFDGFRGRYRFQQLQSQNESTKLNARIAIENTLLSVADAYLSVLSEQDNVDILRQNLEISQNRLDRVREDRRSGTATNLDALNAEVNYNADVIELSAAEVELEAATRLLIFQLGLENEQSVEPANDFPTNQNLELQELLNSTMSQNAAILLAEEQQSNAEFGRNISKAARYPNISLRGSYGYFRQEIDASNLPKLETLGFTAGVTLRYNIFNGRQVQREIENRQLDVQSASIQLESIRQEVQTEVQNVYARYRNTLQQLELAEINVETAQRNFDNSNEAFRLGQISSIELREAQLNLRNEMLRRNNLSFAVKQQELSLMVLSGDWMSF